MKTMPLVFMKRSLFAQRLTVVLTAHPVHSDSNCTPSNLSLILLMEFLEHIPLMLNYLHELCLFRSLEFYSWSTHGTYSCSSRECVAVLCWFLLMKFSRGEPWRGADVYRWNACSLSHGGKRSLGASKFQFTYSLLFLDWPSLVTWRKNISQFYAQFQLTSTTTFLCMILQRWYSYSVFLADYIWDG